MNREIKFRVWDSQDNRMILSPHLSVNAGELMPNYHYEILMQYTGLKDKNGKEIYENDIVKLYYKGVYRYCQIIYQEGIFCLKWDDGYINKYQLYSQSLEVQGNIYQNSELLK